MTAGRLLAHYEKIADAPDAIPRLRRFILDLAVRGKLVEQDPNDEPASELLKRIAAEKTQLAKGSSSRGRRFDGRARTEVFEFALPRGWILSTLGSVALKITDGAHKTPTYVGSGVPFVSVKDFSAGSLNLSNTRFITEKEHSLLYKRCDPKRGDILIGRIGTLGRAVLVDTDDEFSLFVSVGLIRFSHENIVPEFFRTLLNSPLVEDEFDRIKIGGGTHTNKLNLGDLQTVALPIPPLAEQHRIVAKVDELMALCDRLETARTERETTRDRLAAAGLARLNEPDPDPAVFQNQAAFTLDNLIPLTTRPDQIKALRQTILNLAVRGKLVDQDPNDEPAAELLKRIAEDKKKRTTSARDRRVGPVEPLDSTDMLYVLPSSWVWVSFGDITISRDGERVPVSKAEREHRAKVYDYYGASGVIDKIDGYLFDKPLLLIGEDGANLINRSTAIAFIARGKYWVNNHAHVLDGLNEGYLRYLELFINATDLKPFVTGTAQPKMNQTRMNSIPVALPPLAEQHRIVAKVDELMALCDQLEASLAATTETRHRLLNAMLHDALTPSEEESGSIIPETTQKEPDKAPGSPKVLTEPTPAAASPE